MLKLEIPNISHKHSFLEAVREYQAEGLPYYQQFDIDDLNKNFELFLNQLHSESKGENLPDGYVPHTVYWLTDNGKFIGRVDIRHALNDHLQREGGHIGYDIRPTKRKRGYGTMALSLGLEKAKELGFKKVLVTCDIKNVGSNKIIQNNGGELENSDHEKNRYWISI